MVQDGNGNCTGFPEKQLDSRLRGNDDFLDI